MSLRIIAAGMAILVVTLGVTTLAFSKRSQEVNAKLELAQQEIQKLKDHQPSRPESEERLRELLNQQEAANTELRNELSRLEEEHAASDSKFEASARSAADTVQQPALTGRGGPGAWMERIRQQDPERYKQMVADRERRRQDANDWYDTTQEQLQARAQSPTTPEEATLVTQISDTLQKLSDLREQMRAMRQLPEDQRQAQMAQLRPELQATYQQLNTLRDQDRTLQFQNLATQLGLKGDNAQTLVDSIPQIYKNTQYTPPRGDAGPDGFGGGGAAGDRGGSPSGTGSTPSPPNR